MKAKETVGVNSISNDNDRSWRERLSIRRNTLRAGIAMGSAAAVTAAVINYVPSEEKEVVARPVDTSQDAESPLYELAAIEKILTGGQGDPGAGLILEALASQGMINWSEKNYLVAYPADLARGNEGAEIAVRTIVNEYEGARSRGNHTILVSFSWGTVPNAMAATEIAQRNGGFLPPDLTVVSYGGPAYGFAKSDFGRIGKPFAALGGLHYDQELPPGSFDVGSANDFWTSTAHDNYLGAFAKLTAIQVAHRIPHPSEPRISWTDERGVHHERTDVGVHPWTMVLSSNGMYVNEGYNQFFNCMIPVSNGRDAAPEANARCMIDGLAKAWDQQLGSGQVFQILAKFLPSAPVQIGLDVVHKGPDAVISGLANVLDPKPRQQSTLQEVSQVPDSNNNLLALNVAEDNTAEANFEAAVKEQAEVHGEELTAELNETSTTFVDEGELESFAEEVEESGSKTPSESQEVVVLDSEPEVIEQTQQVDEVFVEELVDEPAVESIPAEVSEPEVVVETVVTEEPEVTTPIIEVEAPAPAPVSEPVIVEAPTPPPAPVVAEVEAPAPPPSAPVQVAPISTPEPLVETPAPVVEPTVEVPVV